MKSIEMIQQPDGYLRITFDYDYFFIEQLKNKVPYGDKFSPNRYYYSEDHPDNKLGKPFWLVKDEFKDILFDLAENNFDKAVYYCSNPDGSQKIVNLITHQTAEQMALI